MLYLKKGGGCGPRRNTIYKYFTFENAPLLARVQIYTFINCFLPSNALGRCMRQASGDAGWMLRKIISRVTFCRPMNIKRGKGSWECWVANVRKCLTTTSFGNKTLQLTLMAFQLHCMFMFFHFFIQPMISNHYALSLLDIYMLSSRQSLGTISSTYTVENSSCTNNPCLLLWLSTGITDLLLKQI